MFRKIWLSRLIDRAAKPAPCRKRASFRLWPVECLESRVTPAVTFDNSVAGKLAVNLSAAGDAAVISQTAGGGVTVNGNSAGITAGSLTTGIVVSDTAAGGAPAQSVTFDSSGGAAVAIPGTVGVVGMEAFTIATGAIKLAAAGPLLAGTTTFVGAGVAGGTPVGPVSSADLINGLQPSAVTNGSAGAEGSGVVDVLTDGLASTFTQPDDANLPTIYTIGNNGILTYDLNLAANPGGYDISNINVFASWRDTGRAQISLTDVSYSTVAAPNTFVAISGTSALFPGAVAATNYEVLYSSSNGLMATGVAKVRFNFGAQQNGYVGYGELDVIGVPSGGPSTFVNFSATDVTVAAGATMDANGNSIAARSLAGAGTVVNNRSTVSSLSVDGGTFGGAIQSGAGSLALTKSSGGTLILNSSSPTYGATATINGGTLQLGDGVSALAALPSGAIAVNAGTLIINNPSGSVTAPAVISGAGGLTIQGPGTVTLTGANTYTGPTSVTGGATVNAAGAVLGASTATVAANAVLNAAGNLALGGLAGAGLVHANAFDLTVGGNNSATTFTGTIDGAGGLVKVGAGNLTLGTNTYTGTTTINAGNLVATTSGSLGTGTAPVVVQAGGGLRLISNISYDFGKPLSIVGNGPSGVGALNTLGSNVTLTTPLTLTGSAAIGSGSPATKLILNGQLSMPLLSDLTFVGSGDIDVALGFGNGNTPVQTNAALFAQYVHNSPNRTTSDLDGVGAAPGNQGLLIPDTPWEGNSGLMKTAFNFNDPGASAGTAVGTFSHLFDTPGLNIDDFSVYFTGQMNVTTAGSFIFASGNVANLTGLGNPDAQGRIYIDLDKNHIFEDSNNELVKTTGGGTFGDGQETSVPVNLAVGTYDILFPFTNGSGSGGINFSYSANGGASYQLIDPSRGTVGGVSFTNPNIFTLTPVTNVINNNTGRVTLLGNNTYNGTTTVNAGTLVAGSNTALGLGTSVVVNNNGSLGLPAAGGVAIPASKTLSLIGPGAGGAGALVNLGGDNTVSAPINLARDASIGSSAGNLTINGAGVNINSWNLTVTGAGNTTIHSPITGIATGAPGLVVGQSSIDNDSALASQPNPAFGSDIDLTTTMGNTHGNDAAVAQTNQKIWATNNTWFYKGQMFWPNSNGNGTGTLSFGENVDDRTFLWIDGVQKINDSAWNVPRTSGPITLPTGWHDFEVRFANGGGGAGAVADGGTGWSTTKGFGYRINHDPVAGGINGEADPLASSVDGNDYIIPVDDGTGSLFRGTVSLNALTKTGAGTLTLGGDNTYKRNTVITAGTVNTTKSNAFGNDPAATLTVSGAANVNLFNDAAAVTTVSKADLAYTTGTFNTGAGKLAVGSQLNLPNGYTVKGDIAAQGANLADNSLGRTLSAVSGMLELAHVDTSVISSPDKGTLFGPGASQTNLYNYTADASAEMLVVVAASRSDNANCLPSTITYDGQALTLAVNALGVLGTFVNSHIYYLPFPTTGLSAPLVVNFSQPVSSTAVYAMTLSGLDTSAAPVVGSTVDESSATAITVGLNNVIGGSWAVSEFTYRKGTGGSFTETTTNGTPITGGVHHPAEGANTTTTPASGNLWFSEDGNIIAAGMMLANLAAGGASITGAAAGPAGTHYTGAAAAFAPIVTPSAVNLPATNISLAAGLVLSLDGPGDHVLGTVTHAGNASIQAGANPPTSLTVGGIRGPGGTGILTINNNLGLKFAANSSVSVDVDGPLVGTNYDQVDVKGAVDLTGASLTVASGFSPAVGDSFTIIKNDGVEPVVGAFTGLPQGATVAGGAGTYAINYAGGDGNDVALTVTASTGTPPTVTSFTINGSSAGFGGNQRSRVVDLTIVFDQAVQLDFEAVTLALHPNVDFGGPQPGGMGALPTLTATSADNKTFKVSFSGANTVVDPGTDGFQSLKDGVYDYTIVASKVHPLGRPGVNMAANSTGTFHRLFSDINPPTQTGNSFTAIVNTGDNLQFRNAFNKPVGGGYLPYFDVNGDGAINSGDNLQFRNRFNKALTWTV
jgi:fibronectin-binding autotransporter adhesin